MGFLAGKRALIVGVATERSIAWGIAQAMHREGAELAFSYPNDRMKERVEPLANSLGSKLTMQLDVTVDGQIDATFLPNDSQEHSDRGYLRFTDITDFKKGMRFDTASPRSRASRFMSEANAPGAIAVTTMLSLMSCSAMRLVRWISPALLAW